MIKTATPGSQSDFMYSPAVENSLPLNVMNSFKTSVEFEAEKKQATSDHEARSKELISKLEQPGSAYVKNKTFTVTDGGVFLRKGEEIGMFEMGSTIVMLFECSKGTEVLPKPGEKLLMGQRITN
mmetsp:Transcript_37568/g.49437  ORF Transcript_37568/g.49437 Transcript_37568/m.49437 type:complete len:125 (-) Transcript_37568:43-417(-)